MRSAEEKLRELVSQAKDGDTRAYGKIFRICYKDIYDYVIRRVGNRDDAEDITMHVFAQGLKAISSYEDRGFSVKSWLYRIAHNAVVTEYRAQKPDMYQGDIPDVPDEVDVYESIATRAEMDELYQEITRLTPAQSEVLILRFIEDRSVTETAMILGKKEVTVRALQFKGIQSLRNKLAGPTESRNGGAPGSGVPRFYDDRGILKDSIDEE